MKVRTTTAAVSWPIYFGTLWIMFEGRMVIAPSVLLSADPQWEHWGWVRVVGAMDILCSSVQLKPQGIDMWEHGAGFWRIQECSWCEPLRTVSIRRLLTWLLWVPSNLGYSMILWLVTTSDQTALWRSLYYDRSRKGWIAEVLELCSLPWSRGALFPFLFLESCQFLSFAYSKSWQPVSPPCPANTRPHVSLPTADWTFT